MLLFEAAFWRPGIDRPSLDEALADPELARYVEGFGRPGDFGIVAEEGANAVGAAWWRYFTDDVPGYGFVDEDTPEVSVAVLAAHRGRGIGAALLRGLEREAHARRIQRLSLSVEADNPAVALYGRLGLVSLGSPRDAITMVLEPGAPSCGGG